MPHAVSIESASWYICYDLTDGTFHFGLAPDHSHMTTGQPNCELFVSESAMAVRIDELKGIDGWYEAHKPESVNIDDIPSNLT
jgi:hypothetical protein